MMGDFLLLLLCWKWTLREDHYPIIAYPIHNLPQLEHSFFMIHDTIYRLHTTNGQDNELEVIMNETHIE
jgi:hypothetical protein